MTCRTGPAGLCGIEQVRQRGKKGGEPQSELSTSRKKRKTWCGDKTPGTPTENRIHLFYKPAKDTK